MPEPDVLDPLDGPPPVEGESIAGVVTDFEGIPLVGVRVEAAESGGGDLDQLPVLSDGDGRFEVTGLAEGARYDLRFSLGTVRARTLGVPVGTATLSVKLARPQGIVLVVKTGPGQVMPDILGVVLEREAEPRPIREWFGRSVRPRLHLWSIRPGRYTVTVWGGPYLPVRAGRIDVRPDQPGPTVEVLLSALGGTVGGEVADAQGRPCAALVGWRRLDAPGHAPQRMTTHATDGEGNFVLRGLPAGRYRLTAWSEERGIGEAEVDVAEEQSRGVTVTLR
jgi:hypothetical protein